jgi:hypothetical protein
MPAMVRGMIVVNVKSEVVRSPLFFSFFLSPNGNMNSVAAFIVTVG